MSAPEWSRRPARVSRSKICHREDTTGRSIGRRRGVVRLVSTPTARYLGRRIGRIDARTGPFCWVAVIGCAESIVGTPRGRSAAAPGSGRRRVGREMVERDGKRSTSSLVELARTARHGCAREGEDRRRGEPRPDLTRRHSPRNEAGIRGPTPACGDTPRPLGGETPQGRSPICAAARRDLSWYSIRRTAWPRHPTGDGPRRAELSNRGPRRGRKTSGPPGGHRGGRMADVVAAIQSCRYVLRTLASGRRLATSTSRFACESKKACDVLTRTGATRPPSPGSVPAETAPLGSGDGSGRSAAHCQLTFSSIRPKNSSSDSSPLSHARAQLSWTV